MAADTDILLTESNSISLRSAIVLNQRGLVSFVLMPQLDSSIPELGSDAKFEHTWLYRYKRSLIREMILRRDPLSVERDIRPMMFKGPPTLTLAWADSGHSVALFLDGEPWAFIHEKKKLGYSKGILRPTIGNPWNQVLFEETFLT